MRRAAARQFKIYPLLSENKIVNLVHKFRITTPTLPEKWLTYACRYRPPNDKSRDLSTFLRRTDELKVA